MERGKEDRVENTDIQEEKGGERGGERVEKEGGERVGMGRRREERDRR